MDSSTIRQDLERYRQELARLQSQSAIFANMVKNLEDLLAPESPVNRLAPPVLATKTESPQRAARSLDFAVKGTLPMLEAVLRVVRDARGAVLTISEILRRAEVMGARTDSTRPLVIIQNACATLKKRGYPLEMPGPRQWRWTGPLADESTPVDVDQDQSSNGTSHAVSIVSDAWQDALTIPTR